ncbi:MAG TPA: polysaccharide export protein, partial [Gammaproteobacteria bacterium]|nr:polysaccharide export protein [Gammaproteobacteria bacterium]
MFGNSKLLAKTVILLATTLFMNSLLLAEEPDKTVLDAYRIQPGDQLMISVWKEEDMARDVIVRPDGR